MMRKVLFVCTGNYYRSRFAETLFTHHVARHGLDGWSADSAGLRIDREQRSNVGPFSQVALQRLRQLGVDPGADLRMPRALVEADLLGAAEVVMLEEAEHRPMLQEQFPDWVDRVTWWHIRDRDPSAEYDPLAEIEQLVTALVAEKAKAPTQG